MARARGEESEMNHGHGPDESEDEPDFAVESWSMMGAGGGASGAQLAIGIAGGWPLPMGPRLAILSGGLHGSSAAAQGDDAMEELLSWTLSFTARCCATTVGVWFRRQKL